MHKPDPKLGPDEQHKRSVVALEPGVWETWLLAPVDEMQSLIKPSPVEAFDACQHLQAEQACADGQRP